VFSNVANPRTRYKLVTIVLLLAGLGSAVVIYLTARSPDESTMVSDFEGSKRFVHDLELYGGKANVIADKFARWFDGLWHGQSLAFTVAFLTVVIAGGYFLVASRLAAHAASDAAHENNQSEPE
jgi:zona occludens toxin (predicted ATPase)